MQVGIHAQDPYPYMNPFAVEQRQYSPKEKDPMSYITPGLLQGIPAQVLTGVNFALGSSKLDPFDAFPVTLTTEHHKLIHHCTSIHELMPAFEIERCLCGSIGITTHATMMFEEMPTSDFNPMRDVWFPLDLSNAACFNVIMAHSAAHLAYFYDGTATTRGTNSFEALKYKSEALEILNQWLNDPMRALSNDTFAAVVRLLTFEVRACPNSICQMMLA